MQFYAVLFHETLSYPCAFTVYVLPLLECCTIQYCGHPNISKISNALNESNDGTKRLPGLKAYSYESRLQRFNLITLELWRLHIDLVWCYKIVFGLVDVKFDDFFKHALLNLVTSGFRPVIILKLCR